MSVNAKNSFRRWATRIAIAQNVSAGLRRRELKASEMRIERAHESGGIGAGLDRDSDVIRGHDQGGEGKSGGDHYSASAN
jgi:hypothetical protein